MGYGGGEGLGRVHKCRRNGSALSLISAAFRASMLARMHSSGAKLIGTGPTTGALIAEICGGKWSPNRKWIRSALGLFFLFPLATAMPGNRTPSSVGGFRFQRMRPSQIQQRTVPIHHPSWYTSVPGPKSGVIAFRKGLSR